MRDDIEIELNGSKFEDKEIMNSFFERMGVENDVHKKIFG
jgi:hypothetical protein